MAKKMNLLLTVSLAVICLAALILGLTLPMQATPAQAVASEYEKSTATQFQTKNGVLLGMMNAGNFVAMTVENGSIKLKLLTVTDNKISAESMSSITDNMLWDINVPGSISIKNVGTEQYLAFPSSYSYECAPVLQSAVKWMDHGYAQKYIKSTIGSSAYYINLKFYGETNANSKAYLATSNSMTGTSAWTVFEPVMAKATINFNAGDASIEGATATGTMSETTVDQGAQYTLPACGFALDKYAFAGWKIQGDETGTIYQRNDKVTISEDTTFVATWTYDYCAVTFELDGYTSAKDDEYQKGTYTLPKFEDVFPDYEMPADKIADGWLDKETNAKVFSVPKTESVTLVPNLVDAIYLKLDLNGATRNTTSESVYDDYFSETGKKLKKGDNSFNLESNSMYSITAKADCNFAGWLRSDTEEILQANASLRNLDANVTLVAQWEFNGYTVKFMNGDEVHKTLEIAKTQSSLTIYNENDAVQTGELVSDPVLDGWTFAGWRCGGVMLGANKTIALSGAPKTVVLNAVYTKDITLTFKYDGETVYTEVINDAVYDGTTTLANKNAYKGYPNGLPNGKLFDHWEIDGTALENSTVLHKNGDVTIDIIAKDGYKITFDLNGGSQHDNYKDLPDGYWGASYVIEVTMGHAQLSYTSYQPHKDAHIFTGWKCGDLLVTDGTQFDVTSDMKFVAQWKFDGITLNFADDDSTKEVQLNKDAESYVIDFDWTVPAGKVFEGWKLTGDDSDTLYKKGDTVTIPQDTEEMNFVAQIRDLKTYVVTLHYGSLTQTLEFVEGTANITILEKDFVAKFGAVPADKKFISWYAEADFVTVIGVSYLTANDATMTDLHVYAKVVDRLTVTFNFAPLATTVTRTNEDGNGVAVMTATDAEAVTREGYNLRGWSKTEGGSADYYLTSPAIKESCTLYAVWEATPEQALANAKQAAKDEIAAAATEADVTAPATTSIDAATTIDEVNTAKAAALEIIAQAKADKESAAKLADANAAIAALSGKKGSELFTAIKAVETKLNALTEDELEQVNLTAYNAAKTAYNAYVTATVDDLGVAENMAMAVAAVKLATAVTAMAMLAFVLKRRMW